MKTRWTPRPLPLLSLLLAVTLCGVTVAAADQGGWIPIAAPAPLRPHRTSETTPRFGSRIIKPRLPRQEGVTESTTPTPIATSPAIKSSTTKAASPTRSPRQQASSPPPNTEDDEETKSLAQQVADGKYGLIQNELFATRPSRPGIISYAPNHEVPNDNKDNLGGLKPEEIWLSEGHVLVLSGGPLGAEGHWEPIDNYQAPPRQVKLPPNPSVPPPFPVQLQDGGPTGFITSNGSNPFLLRHPPPGNFEPGNGIYPPQRPPPPFPLLNGSYVPPPPQGLFRQENLTQDDDDPSIFYPPPYDFSFQQDNVTEVPPGPLVPGIVLPPPPNFFAPQNPSASPALFIPDDIDNNVEPPIYQLDRLPPLPPRPLPPRPPTRRPYLPPRPVLVITTTPPPVILVSSTPATENEIIVPEYPVNEPNVFLHHHGSPVQFIPKNNSRVVVSPPEKLVVYELPGIPLPPKSSGGRTLVSSTPSPTAIYYTLPADQSPVKFTIYSATPDPVKQLDYFFSTPKPQRPYTTQKPQYQEPTYYDTPTTTPKPVYLFPDTTLAPETTTIAPVRSTTKKPKSHTTKTPKYLPSFQPSPYDFPTTTPAPVFYNQAPKGRYLPHIQANIQDDYYYEQNYQPPRYLPPRPISNYFYPNPPRRPELYYNPRPDPASYFYPPAPQRRPVSPTQAPPYDNYNNNYYQNSQRRPQPEVGFYYPPPQRNQAVSTTQNPLFNGYFTPQDEKYMDDITKSYFNIFGQRITTPLPPLAATESISSAVSLHDDTRVNYRRPLPPINPDSEFIDVRGGRDPSIVSYQLPGQGQRGPSHYYFLTPRGERIPREDTSLKGSRTPRDNSSNKSPKVTPRPLVQHNKQTVQSNTRNKK